MNLWHNVQCCWPAASALSGRCISSFLCFSLAIPSLSDLPVHWKWSPSTSLSTHPLNPSSSKPYGWIRCPACTFSSLCSACWDCGNCNVLLYYVITSKWLKQAGLRFVQAHLGLYMNKPRRSDECTHVHTHTHIDIFIYFFLPVSPLRLRENPREHHAVPQHKSWTSCVCQHNYSPGKTLPHPQKTQAGAIDRNFCMHFSCILWHCARGSTISSRHNNSCYC